MELVMLNPTLQFVPNLVDDHHYADLFYHIDNCVICSDSAVISELVEACATYERTAYCAFLLHTH